jgi:hypothetical protein
MYATLGLTRWKVSILRRSSSVRLVGAPSPSKLEAVIMGAATTALGLRHPGRRAAVGITRRLSSMLGEQRGDEGGR